jgi:hypothetical protein
MFGCLGSFEVDRTSRAPNRSNIPEVWSPGRGATEFEASRREARPLFIPDRRTDSPRVRLESRARISRPLVGAAFSFQTATRGD